MTPHVSTAVSLTRKGIIGLIAGAYIIVFGIQLITAPIGVFVWPMLAFEAFQNGNVVGVIVGIFLNLNMVFVLYGMKA